MLHLFDTATGSVREIVPREPGRLSMYVCGPTVYDDPHIGHGRFTLAWDVLRRYLAWTGVEVNYVSNITDIEDKIIARAAAEGKTAAEVAAHYEQRWWWAMDQLGVARPTAEPHATDYVDHMVELIAALIERGHAYVGGDGVYFAAETIADYGLLARQPLESLRAGARVEVSTDAGKHAPIDFALWKLARPGEPAWPSPWGDGRPGWHTECVVMSLDLLGDGFDVHGGGIDLAFPHHENERAQAEGIGRPFARLWVHSGHVVVEGGEKMSKSLGNYTSLPELLAAHDARAYRLLVLQAHYRSPMTVTPDTLDAAEQAVDRMDRFASDFAAARGGQLGVADAGVLARFRERMDDDLDTPRAVADLFSVMTEARAAAKASDMDRANALAAAVLEITSEALGMVLGEKEGEIDEAAVALAHERDEARAAKDFARADRLRDQIQAMGYTVEDTAGGTVIRIA